MGCASWSASARLERHAAVASAARALRESGGQPVFESVTALSLNEVGVTDEVMDTLWQCGPTAASYAVTAGAETHHVGADIAILRPSTTKLIHYQAKLGRLDGSNFCLKTPVSQAQVQKLNRRTVPIQGVTYTVTGRIAVYQANERPFLRGACSMCALRHFPWPLVALSRWDNTPDPTIGRNYYKEVLAACRCSPSGVVAAPVPPRGSRVTVIRRDTTWPWEFDFHEWVHARSPLDGGGELSDDLPEFEEYRSVAEESLSQDQVERIAAELAVGLDLPASQQLHLIVLP